MTKAISVVEALDKSGEVGPDFNEQANFLLLRLLHFVMCDAQQMDHIVENCHQRRCVAIYNSLIHH